MGCGHIRQWTPTVMLHIGSLHQELISFMVVEVSTADIILGCPWMSQHSQPLNWNTGEIQKSSYHCLQNCLLTVPRPPSHQSANEQPSSAPIITLNSTTIESPETISYMAFQNVFSDQLATKLPPHWPWYCSFDRLAGATLPKGKLYPLSILEQKAMEEYIEEALNKTSYAHQHQLPLQKASF